MEPKQPQQPPVSQEDDNVIAYLDPNNPEEKEIIDHLDAIRAEIRKEYPNPMDIVDTYRKGYIDYGWMSGGFNKEEIKEILDEAGRRNEADKERER
jgi:hypothetical protein